MTLLPKSYLDSRLTAAFDYYQIGSDFGMLMHSPIVVDVENSTKKYQRLFENWQSFVDHEKHILGAINPDILISNISPVSLDAAHQLGIKTASVAPFNWAQIYAAYCLDGGAETEKVLHKMCSVYQAVDQIFKPIPFVPLDDGNEIVTASINDQPIADLLSLQGKLPNNVKQVGLIALGGLPFSLDLKNWPQIAGLHWLVDQVVPRCRQDMSQIDSLSTPFLQLVAACDLIITKPGYGTYCEIAALAKHKKIRAISLSRPDWPETPYLNQFLAMRVPFVEIEEAELTGKRLAEVIQALNQCDYPAEVMCEDGAMQVVNRLVNRL